jgi:hypothetical protein
VKHSLAICANRERVSVGSAVSFERPVTFMTRNGRRRGSYSVLCRVTVILAVMQCVGCRVNVTNASSHPQDMARRDINAVLSEHDDALMAIEGVVGVYVGLLEDEKTPCLKVMVVRQTPELTRRIPSSLEGYPVVVEETGIIRPLPSP